MATEGRKVGYEEVTEIQTGIILSVNYGLNYSRKLHLDVHHGKTEATYVRELNRLSKIKWLIKEPIKNKNMKVYSINWNIITDSFIEHLIKRFKSHLAEQKIWAKQNFYMQSINNGNAYTKLLKPEGDIKKDIEQIKKFNLVIKSISKAKREKKNLLIPFFQKDVFIISYELDFKGDISLLYDEIIYGIGKSYHELSKRKTESNIFLNNIIYICYILYSIEKERYSRPFSNSFQRYFKELK